MGNLYAIYQSQVAPGCLQRPNGKIIESALGAEKDVEQERARQGIVANIPGAGPVDATPYIGQERQLPQAVGEGNSAYAERLRTVWDAPSGWSFGGGDWSILQALARAGFPMGTATGVNIVKRFAEYSYLAAGVLTRGAHAPFNFDSAPPAQFTQFMCVIGADFSPPIGSTFQNGDPSADLFNSLVYKWKPSKWRFMGTAVIISGHVWGWPPGQTWGAGGSGLHWGGGSTRFVAPST